MAAIPPSTASTDSLNIERRKTCPDRTNADDTISTDQDDRTRHAQTDAQMTYRNSLLAMVGWLDFTNSLDFPANVFNQTPLPLHAVVLMGLCGSVAVIATAWGIWDMFRCWKNIRFLRAERQALQEEHKQFPNAGNSRLRRAWLGVNFRELGWELVDRLLLDFIMIFSGLFVGAGTLMAIRGEDPTIFLVSNLLSGYVGNSWMPFYALINSIWSSYMYIRASRSEESVRKSKVSLDERIAHDLRVNHRRHKTFSSGTAVTMCIASVGAMMSATMWYGYVVLAPCCVSSIVLNWHWRKKLGYNRPSFHGWVGRDEDAFHILPRIQANIAAKAYIRGKSELLHGVDITDAAAGDKPKFDIMLLALMTELDLAEVFCSRVSNDLPAEPVPLDFFRGTTSEEAGSSRADHAEVTAGLVIKDVGIDQFRSRERFLLELFGYYLCSSDPEHEPVEEKA